MSKILIFGISGFTGGHLERFLSNNGHQTYGIDVNRYDGNLSEVYIGDTTDFEFVKSTVNRIKPEFIVNLIGKFDGDKFEEYLKCNVLSSQVIMETIVQLELNIDKLLLIGSAAEYGFPMEIPITESHPLNPVSYYGVTKVMQYHLMKCYFNKYRIPVVLARTFNIKGRGISRALSVGNFSHQIANALDGSTIKVGNLMSKRDYMPIEEVTAAYYKLLEKGKEGEVYNVCSGKSTSIKDLLDELIADSGKSLGIITDQDLIKSNDISEIYGSNQRIVNLK